MSPPKILNKILETIIVSETDCSETSFKARHMLNELQDGNKVCLLRKALYGLRQSGKCWYARLDSVLRKCGAKPCNTDPCMYHIRLGKNLLLIAVYVDDILISSRDSRAIKKIKENLSREFKVKDLGEVNHCLGIQFLRDGNRIIMHQKRFIEETLERFGMTDSKPVGTPMDLNVKLTKPKNVAEPLTQKLPFRELIGTLTYLAVATRPDIAFAASSLSQFNDSFDNIHWTATKRVLRYLKGTMSLGLTFEANSVQLKGFVDADWGNCPVDRRSYTGYTFTLCGGSICWESRKQRTVALSSTEAEYMGLAEAAKEAIYLRSFLMKLGLDNLANIVIHNDNMGTKKLAENPVFHSRSKHIDLRHHFVRDAIQRGLFEVKHIPSEDMTADMLTKSLPKLKHTKHSSSIGLFPIPASS